MPALSRPGGQGRILFHDEMTGGSQPTPIDNPRAGVLAVDDDSPFLALLHDLVRATRLLKVIGEAESGERGLELAQKLSPDMIVMDVRMPGLGGIEAARRIKASLPPTAVVLISTTHPDELPRDVEDCGADAVIWKSELQPQLLDEIWLCWRGQAEPCLDSQVVEPGAAAGRLNPPRRA